MGRNISKVKVSVIIPVYNTSEYVEEAVRSIMKQTLSDLEIIIINDGSTDNSLQIVTQLQKLDQRIFIYSQENQGQSVARNLGLRVACGEYIYFMDSDDILNENALEMSYDRCISEDLDFAFFDALNFGEGSMSFPLTYNRKGKIDEKLIYKGADILNILVDIKEYRVPVWLYFIKASFIKDNQLEFKSGISHEDQIFTAQIFYLAERVGYIPEIFFLRRIRANSVMTSTFSLRNINSYFEIVRYLLKFTQNKSHSIQELNKKTIKFILDPAIYNSHSLNLRERLYVAKTGILEFSIYVSVKSWLVLFFPWLVTLKSYFKKL